MDGLLSVLKAAQQCSRHISALPKQQCWQSQVRQRGLHPLIWKACCSLLLVCGHKLSNFPGFVVRLQVSLCIARQMRLYEVSSLSLQPLWVRRILQFLYGVHMTYCTCIHTLAHLQLSATVTCRTITSCSCRCCVGDTTSNLLWRIQHGEGADGLNPTAMVLLVGTNDLALVPQLKVSSSLDMPYAHCTGVYCASTDQRQEAATPLPAWCIATWVTNTSQTGSISTVSIVCLQPRSPSGQD